MVEIHVLGTTSITTDDGTTRVLDVGGVKARQILEILALSHGVAVGKDELAEALWDGRPPATYGPTLESHVSVARRHLVELGVPRGVLATVHDGYLLTTEVELDLSTLRRALRATVGGPSWSPTSPWDDCLPTTETRLLASSPYACWAVAARQELDDQLVLHLHRTATACVARGDLSTATASLVRAQRIDALSELTVQLLLRVLLDQGTWVDALVCFERFRSRLRDDLGTEPSPQTIELYLGILRAIAQRTGELEMAEAVLLQRLLGQVGPSSAAGASVVIVRPTPPAADRLLRAGLERSGAA